MSNTHRYDLATSASTEPLRSRIRFKRISPDTFLVTRIESLFGKTAFFNRHACYQWLCLRAFMDIPVSASEYRQLSMRQLHTLLLSRRSELTNEAVIAIERELLDRELGINADWPTNPDFKERQRAEQLDDLVQACLVVEAFFLVPWLPFSMVCGMAMDSGRFWSATIIIWSTWLYGPAVFAAFKLRDRSRKSVLLPLISVLGWSLAALLDALGK
jgi:hypothetical protein